MTAETAKYVTGRFKFLYYRRIGIVDVYELGKDLPSRTIKNVDDFVDISDFIDYCKSLIPDKDQRLQFSSED